MSQLTGPEQQALVSLLIEQVRDGDSLDRALFHAGMGHLSTYAEQGTLPAMMADTVEKCSSQYRIPELVKAILNHAEGLNGTCPPIESWLTDNEAELQERSQRARRTQDLVTPRRPAWLWSTTGGVLAFAAIVSLGLYRPWNRPKVEAAAPPIRLSFAVSEVEIDDEGKIERRTPVANAKIELAAMNFEPKRVEGGTTDASGRGLIEIFRDPTDSRPEIKVYLRVAAVPATLEGRSPWISTHHGAVKRGDGIEQLGPPLKMDGDVEVDIDIVPLSEAGRFYLITEDVHLTAAESERRDKVIRDSPDKVRRPHDSDAPKWKFWPNGGVITIAFMDGSPSLQSFVRETAAQWTRHTNVQFQYVEKSAASEVRISFSERFAAYSFVGTDALGRKQSEPTMQLGMIATEQDEDQRRLVVLREFGHMLGFINEHQTPNASALRLDWDRVYDDAAKRYGWTRATVV